MLSSWEVKTTLKCHLFLGKVTCIDTYDVHIYVCIYFLPKLLCCPLAMRNESGTLNKGKARWPWAVQFWWKTFFGRERSHRIYQRTMWEASLLHLLVDGAAHLPANLIWVQRHLPLAVAFGKCQAPLRKGVHICAQITKMGINSLAFLVFTSPKGSLHAPAHCLSLSPGGPRMDCPESQWDCSKTSWKWSHCVVTEIKQSLCPL